MSTPKKQTKFFETIQHVQSGRLHPSDVCLEVRKAAKKISPSVIKQFNNKNKLPLKIKKEVLSVLKDIVEPMYLNENESPSNPVSKTFNVDGDFELEIKRYVGLPLSEKELEAINNYTEIKPNKIEKNEIRYETTDAFNNTTTSVIKKLKEGGNRYTFTAFIKYDQPEKEDKPPETTSQSPFGGNQQPPQQSQEPEEKSKKDKIIITKSTPFEDDISGGAILSEFLKKLDL